MDLAKYPMDEQECMLHLESCECHAGFLGTQTARARAAGLARGGRPRGQAWAGREGCEV